LPILPETFKRRLFWIIARVCFTGYHWFPIFGRLRASIAIIHRDGKFLLIQRNDGRGVSLPGGIASWRESEILTLRREVLEETGMRVTAEVFRLRYFSRADVPCNISVFEVTACGDLKMSWEGTPHWMTVAEIEPKLLESQRPVLDLLREISSRQQAGGAEAETIDP